MDDRIVKCGYWFDGYDESKKTIVFALGIIAGYAVNDNIRILAETFNVYVLETMYIVWSDLNALSFQDVVDIYYSQMLTDIPNVDRVKGIMGFSFAGKIAYSLASRYDDQFGHKPLVILGDTSLHFSVEKDVKPLNPSFHPDLAAALKMTYDSIETIDSLPERKYEGEVVFLVATADAEPETCMSKEWEVLFPSMKTICVDDDHNGLFQNPEHYELYKRLLLDDGSLCESFA